MHQSSDYYSYNEKFFKRYAPIYDLIVRPLASLRREVVAIAGARSGQRVLDLACGTGEQSLAFARAGCSVVGVDLCQDMLARARAKVRPGQDVAFVRHDASSLPFAPASFDIATVSLALHDMPLDVARAVLREAKRVTRTPGRIVVVDYSKPSRMAGRLIHGVLACFESKWYHQFMRKGLPDLLYEAGLSAQGRHTRLCGAVEILVCPALVEGGG